MYLVVIGGEFSSKMEMVFLFRRHDSCKQYVKSPPNNIIVGIWSFKDLLKLLQQALHFYSRRDYSFYWLK